jgi:hypothetical protein
MKRIMTIGAAVLTAAALSACDVAVDLGADSLFPTGTSFVVRGTADVFEGNGSCPIWIGENGVIYHLFQNPRVPNEEFDRVITPGTTSRLELAVRTDLVVTCQVGTIAEVEDILEIPD